jgi:protein ImuB
VRALAAELAHRLSIGGLACTLLEVAVELTDGEQVVRRWHHEGPFAAALVAERLRFQLEVFLVGRHDDEGEVEGRGIERLRLEALEVGPDSGRSFELWGVPAHDEEQVGRTFARLQGIAGPEAVLRPVVVGARGPGERVRLVPFGEGLPAGEGLPGAPWPGGLPAPSPTLLADGPLTVLDAAGRPVAVDGRGEITAAPALVAEGGEASAVTAWGGPWPAEERWWEPARHRRRARVQLLLEDGRAFLCFVEQGSWQLEGRYD